MSFNDEDRLNIFYGFWHVLEEIHELKRQIRRLEERQMASIQELLDDENVETSALAELVGVVQGQTTSIASLTALVEELRAQIGQLTPEQQAQLDQVNAAQDANLATIQSLLPAAPPPEG